MRLAVSERMTRNAFIQEKAILKFHLSQRTSSAIYSNTKKNRKPLTLVQNVLPSSTRGGKQGKLEHKPRDQFQFFHISTTVVRPPILSQSLQLSLVSDIMLPEILSLPIIFLHPSQRYEKVENFSWLNSRDMTLNSRETKVHQSWHRHLMPFDVIDVGLSFKNTNFLFSCFFLPPLIPIVCSSWRFLDFPICWPPDPITTRFWETQVDIQYFSIAELCVRVEANMLLSVIVHIWTKI